MNIPPVSLRVPTSAPLPVAVDTPLPTPPTGQEEDLKKATSDFVALLYAHMFQTMREAGQDEDGEGMFSGFEAGMFMGFFDYDVGQKFAQSGGSSLVDALYRQLTKRKGQLEGAAPAGPAAGNTGVGADDDGRVSTDGPAVVVPPPPMPPEMPGLSDQQR